MIPLSVDGHSITVPTELIAHLILAGLRLYDGEEFSRKKLLTAPIPPTEEIAVKLDEVVKGFAPDRLELAVYQELDKIDQLVGTTLGLTEAQIALIGREMAEDPFLSRIRPRYPYFTPKLRGRRLRLESSARYGRETATRRAS